LPQLFADMHGWPELAATVRGVVDGLSPTERAHAVILTANYGQASAIELFGSELPVGSDDNGWWLWGPPEPTPSVVVWISGRRENMDELFADVREVATFDHPLMRADERGRVIYVAREPKMTLAEGWPRLKVAVATGR